MPATLTLLPSSETQVVSLDGRKSGRDFPAISSSRPEYKLPRGLHGAMLPDDNEAANNFKLVRSHHNGIRVRLKISLLIDLCAWRLLLNGRALSGVQHFVVAGQDISSMWDVKEPTHYSKE